MKTLVCLPTRNERESVAAMIERIRSLGYDLILSDERSDDGTVAIAEGLGVTVHQRDGSGKGFGVRKALEVAAAGGYDVLVLIDCDLTYPVERIPDLLAQMQTADMVVGCRDFRDDRPAERALAVTRPLPAPAVELQCRRQARRHEQQGERHDCGNEVTHGHEPGHADVHRAPCTVHRAP